MWPISKDGRIDRLIVFLAHAGSPIPVGELVFEGRDRRQSLFRYARTWLQASDAYALAPGLALRPRAVPSAPYETPLAFYDAVPDGWGKSILAQAYPQQQWGMAEYLAAAGSDRVGALRFGPAPDRLPEQFVPPGGPMVDLADGEDSLEDLLDAAMAVDEGRARNHHLHLLFRSSADLGGARPKAQFCHAGQAFLAKFPAQGDSFDEPRIEAVCLDVAQSSGITTPDHALESVAGRSVLLVRRFDRIDGFQLGYMSAGVLMDRPPDEYATTITYADIAAKARAWGIEPCEAALFRRALFNAFIHNTDDHLRNHAFLRDGTGWHLSPVFDIVPHRRMRMVLAAGRGIEPLPDPARLFAAYPQFKLSRADAEQIYAELADGMAGLPKLLDRREVTGRDRDTLKELMPFAFNPPALLS